MSSPVLSYKKPSQKREKSTNEHDSSATSPVVAQNPNLSQDGSTHSPNLDSSTRKVLSRRKALQEFYHLQQQEQQKRLNSEGVTSEGAIPVTNPPSPEVNRKESITKGVDFDDPDQFHQFIRNTPVQDILKLRNSITTNLNSHDSEKKAIIYDNYYELIKLNETLQSLSKPITPPKQEQTFKGLNITADVDEDKNVLNNKDSLLSCLADLQDFVTTKSKAYHGNFPEVISKLQSQYQTSGDQEGPEDNASIQGVVDQNDEVLTFPESLNKSTLVEEINYLLNTKKVISDSNRESLRSQIDTMVKKLGGNDELLVLQLNSIKRSLATL